jgi:hypothetical protein
MHFRGINGGSERVIIFQNGALHAADDGMAFPARRRVEFADHTSAFGDCHWLTRSLNLVQDAQALCLEFGRTNHLAHRDAS